MKLILEHIKNKLNDGNYLFSREDDVFFMTRFNSSNLTILLINGEWYALTDQRYYNAAINALPDFKVIDAWAPNWLSTLKSENSFDTLFIDSSFHSVEATNSMIKNFGNEGVTIKPKNFGYIRDIYLEEDLNKIRKSVEINDRIFLEVKDEVKVGMTEKEVYKLVLTKIVNSEADCQSFDPIIAGGTSGSGPHHHAGDRIINENEMLTIDMGVFYKGFASDMTRTFVVSGKVSEEEELIWNTVKHAMETCIQMIKPGVATKEIHAKAVEIISDAGYGQYFTHGLGHGLGVEIHDQPVLSPKSNDILKVGQTVTVEPGIYIPGKYGVRLEQDIIVTKDGFEVLQKCPVELY